MKNLKTWKSISATLLAATLVTSTSAQVLANDTEKVDTTYETVNLKEAFENVKEDNTSSADLEVISSVVPVGYLANNIFALSMNLEKISNPRAKEALQKNIERAIARWEAKQKAEEVPTTPEEETTPTEEETSTPEEEVVIVPEDVETTPETEEEETEQTEQKEEKVVAPPVVAQDAEKLALKKAEYEAKKAEKLAKMEAKKAAAIAKAEEKKAAALAKAAAHKAKHENKHEERKAKSERKHEDRKSKHENKGKHEYKGKKEHKKGHDGHKGSKDRD